MSGEPRIVGFAEHYAQLGEVHSYDELLAVLGARIVDLNASYETIDHVAGLPSRYTSRIFGPARGKRLGPVSLAAILGALGVKLIVVEDPEQLARIRRRLTKRYPGGPQSHWRRRLGAVRSL